MMMMMIDTIWDELEKDNSFGAGLLYKRYSSNIRPDVYIALRAPEKHRCIAFLIDSSFCFDTTQWNTLKDIKLELMPDESNQNKRSEEHTSELQSH